MPPATRTRSPLQLLALVARRGLDDLHALAAVARGEEIDPQHRARLVRAGVLRAGGKLPSKLMVPVLALEASLGMSGEKLLAQFTRMLGNRSTPPAQRDQVLDALADELHEQLELFSADTDRPAAAETERLRAVLDELRDTLQRLTAEDADPAQVTRVAVLCARLIERLAPRISPKPTRRPRERPLAGAGSDPADLADAAWGVPVRLTQPVVIPSVNALASAALGPAPVPQSTSRRAQLPSDQRAGRAEKVAETLRSSSDALTALYAGQPLDEALRRHVCVTALGAQRLREAGVQLSGDRTPGPGPLQWSTRIVRRDEAAHAEAA